MNGAEQVALRRDRPRRAGADGAPDRGRLIEAEWDSAAASSAWYKREIQYKPEAHASEMIVQ